MPGQKPAAGPKATAEGWAGKAQEFLQLMQGLTRSAFGQHGQGFRQGEGGDHAGGSACCLLQQIKGEIGEERR